MTDTRLTRQQTNFFNIRLGTLLRMSAAIAELIMTVHVLENNFTVAELCKNPVVFASAVTTIGGSIIIIFWW